MLTIPQAFALALQHHQAGRLAEAEALYRQILAVQPRHSEALLLLGLVVHQAGRDELAVEWIREAIRLQPNNPVAYCHLGDIEGAIGHPDEAIAQYRRALEFKPDCLEAWHNLGTALGAQGRHDEAVAALRRVLELRPDLAEACYNLGVALQAQGQFDEAMVAYERALELQPGLAKAHYNLGIVLHQRGQLDASITAYRRALELEPNYAEAHSNLGNALKDSGQFEEAIAAYRRALELRPDFAEAHNNLGGAFNKLGRTEEAMAAYRRALELQPEFAEAHSNLGAALVDLGKLDEAMASHRRALELAPRRPQCHYNLAVAHTARGNLEEAVAAYGRTLELKPDYHEAQFNYAFLLLLHGDFERGWPLYESRWELPGARKRNVSQPQWDGGDIAGKRVLLHAEQGFGDSIQFVRYAPLVAERGAEVIIECQCELVELFRSVKGASAIVARGEALPPFDRHVPMLSQPLVFRTRAESIPAEVPYLFAEPGRREAWAQRLGNKGARLRVGLRWTGDPKHPRTAMRDIPLETLFPILRVADVDFFSLQVGAGAEQIEQLPAPVAIMDHTAHLRDFADTAALIAKLDLIISVDTCVAHLVGALGRPVWTLLPFVPDWRWGLVGEATPWYPTMRLFRQQALGDWASVIERVADELKRAMHSLALQRDAKGAY